MTKHEMNLKDPANTFLPSLSVDCVLLSFHDNQLKVLLLKAKDTEIWSLPGGFVAKSETLEQAATRILYERTGVENIFLTQFRVYSDVNRKNPFFSDEKLVKTLANIDQRDWYNQRFLSVGFYALVEYAKVDASPDSYSERCVWRSIDEVGPLMMDHNLILEGALETLRLQLRYQPIGFNLLPEKFTMPELQKLYETILGRELDRRNFQRKILSYKILKRLPERRQGVAYKAPYLYCFDLDEYNKALEQGLSGEW